MPVLVLGVVLARCPRGAAGHTCAVMNWALAFRRLGWEVHLVECLSPDELEQTNDGTSSVQEEFWRATCEEFGFADRQSLLIRGQEGSRSHPARAEAWERFRSVAGSADTFLNYSGQFKELEFFRPGTKKIYLDVDPAFTQLWVEVSGISMNLAGHDCFWTIGKSLGRPEVELPHCGVEWVPTLPVVDPEFWWDRVDQLEIQAATPTPPAWTTIAHWYGYNGMPWNGRLYTGKRESFLALRDLPRQTSAPLVLATDLQREWGDYDEFEQAGWHFLSSAEVCADVPAYLNFIRGSRGELGIAKGGYLTSQCGWVSDRSLVYLALGRPVLLQNTGWPIHVPEQPGLRAFMTPEEAAARLKEIEESYASESAGAVRIAETFFSPSAVLTPLLAAL